MANRFWQARTWKELRANGSALKKVVFAVIGIQLVRHLYPELRRYIRLHEM